MARRFCIERIHREIAACSIFFKRCAKDNLSVPTIGGHIFAKCCDFVRFSTHQKRQCSMICAGIDNPYAMGLSNLPHLIWLCVTGQINISCHNSHHRIANTAAHIQEPRARLFEGRKKRR